MEATDQAPDPADGAPSTEPAAHDQGPTPGDRHEHQGPRPAKLADEVPFAAREEPASGLPKRLEAWRRRSAAGAVFTGFAFGLREVFEPSTDEQGVMIETSGAPPRDLPVEADLEDSPSRASVVRIRPWLLDEAEDRSGDRPQPAADAPSADAPSADAGRAGSGERPPTAAPPRRPRPKARWGRRR